jgi:hypothetical protein
MTNSSSRDLLDAAWNYPLFEALYGRRSRRFGLGFAMAEGPFAYASAHAPLPLNEFEEALLVAAGFGTSGIALWDLSRPTANRGPIGRTFPSTSGGRRTALFFTNDQGVYAITPDQACARTMREIGAPDARERMLALYQRRRLLRDGRLAIARRVPPLSGHNLWDSNGPGSTLFMPVCDLTYSLIARTAEFVDAKLERFVARGGRGMHIVDDRHGFRPAGTERWVKSGFLDADNVLPLSHLERQAGYFMFSEPAVICQNMFLATEAMGIGGWMHCGFLSREIFETLGFTMTIPQAAPALANPVGLDGIFEAYCPPYFPSMDAAVDAVLAPRQPRDASANVTPPASAFLMSEADYRRGTVAVSEEGIACTKAVCNYIYEMYGRFPGTLDAMHLMWFMQAHHLDTQYYDRFFHAGAYGPTHAAHLATWHSP